MTQAIDRQAREIVQRHRPPEIMKFNGFEMMPVEGAVASVREALAMRAKEQSHSQATPETGWQGIETAPRDGTKIDVWVEREGKVPLRIPNAYFCEGRWLHSFNGMRIWHEPTHWMPQPQPPASDLGKAKP